MLATIDLTQRQAARVLAQALRTRVRLEIESRSREGTISGSLASAENSTLCVELHDHGVDTPLAGQIGSFCDVRAVLSGHLYLFSTCIVDVLESTVPQRLLLAVPDTMQIVNRRRFDRTIPQEHIPLHMWPGGSQHPFVGTLTDIGPAGLGCQMPRRDLEHLLLIDDEVRVRFQLPAGGESFDLEAIVCVKSPSGDSEHLNVGLEFCPPRSDQPDYGVMERLRALLARDYTQPTRKDGEA